MAKAKVKDVVQGRVLYLVNVVVCNGDLDNIPFLDNCSIVAIYPKNKPKMDKFGIGFRFDSIDVHEYPTFATYERTRFVRDMGLLNPYSLKRTFTKYKQALAYANRLKSGCLTRAEHTYIDKRRQSVLFSTLRMFNE